MQSKAYAVLTGLRLSSSGVVLVLLLLTLNIFHTPCSSVSIVNFEQVNTDWVSEDDLAYYS